MVERVSDLSPEAFADLVRDALLHLYDATYLQRHPLVQFVDAPSTSNTVLRGKLLLQGLLDAIRSLRPVDGTPADSRAWRTYRLLELRYIEGDSAGEASNQLGLAKTQYHKDHARALEAIASLLWERWRLGQDRAPRPSESESWESLAHAETEQLAARMCPECINLGDVLSGLLALLRPASEENHVASSFRVPPDLPPIFCDRVALRQILLSLLNTAIERGAGGTLDISIELLGDAIQVTLAASPGPVAAAPAESARRTGAGLAVARRLAEAIGGHVDVPASGRPPPLPLPPFLSRAPPGGTGGATGRLLSPSPVVGPAQERQAWGDAPPLSRAAGEGVGSEARWTAAVRLPVAQPPVVLVLDNHQGFIDLLTRYVAEHGWRVVGAQTVQEAHSLVLEMQPSVILLDVLMPGQDGWDLLLTLRSRAETREIPVIVCSILYEPQVARSLGATGYLPKPVTQAALLEALAPYRPGGRQPGL
ncbi:MAG: response regulator [Chloroflexi bacterium]|nr:response regulator [Chloroflexota bacterium]